MGATTLSIMGLSGTLSIMTFTLIKTLSPTGLFATLSITLSSAVVQSDMSVMFAIMLNVFMLSVMAPFKGTP